MKLPTRRRFLLVLAFAVCLFLIYSAVGERGFLRLIRMIDQRDELKSHVLDLREGNTKLAEQIGLLREDPATIEYLARTELGMVRDGETVYIITERPGKEPQ